MSIITVKDFREEDIDDVLKIEATSGFSDWTEEMFLSEYKNRYSYFKTAVSDGIIVGFIIYSVIFEESEIFNIVIKDNFRKRSFGSYLLNFAVSDAVSKNAKKIFLEVSDRNIPAVSLYKKSGFIQYGERKNYYKNGDNALLMVKNIKDADFLINKC